MSGCGPARRLPWVLGVGIVAAFVGAAPASAPRESDGPGAGTAFGPRAVTALGRLEPGGGVIRLAGPSGPAVVERLLVEEGERVAAGQTIAVLDSHALHLAELDGLEAELEHARLEHLRGQRAHVERGDGARAARLARIHGARRAQLAHLGAQLLVNKDGRRREPPPPGGVQGLVACRGEAPWRPPAMHRRRR